MSQRFTYSRWDGTQTGFEFDADAAFDELTDELLYHGDVNAALRRMMQEGLRDRDGNDLQGLRELLDKLRQAREDRLANSDLGGVYDEINDEINDILDEERHAIENALADAQNSGDERRATNAAVAAEERNMRLDLMPDDLAGKVRELSAYNFESADAKQRFEQLMDKLKDQLMQQMVDQMSGAMQNMTPGDMSRMKDMMAALNEMLEKHQRGEADTGFDEFMEEFGDFFPENPQNVDELLAQMAQRMAAMQAMMNSMTPEQRAQLQELSDQLMGDMDLQWQMQQLSGNLQQMFPQMQWNQSYDFEGQDPMGFGQAMQAMQELGDLDQLENLLRNAASPSALAEADMDKVRNLLGDDAAKSLERLAELTQQLEQAGLIQQKEGKLELTPKGLRKIGSNALRELFSKMSKDMAGQHEMSQHGIGHERTYDTKQYEYGDPFQLDLNRTIRNAVRRSAGQGHRGTPVKLSPDDFEVERTEHLTRSSTVLMLDLSLSMPMRDNFLPAKKVAMALHHLISTQFPRDYLGIVGFSETARILTAAQLPEVSWDFVYGTNMHHGFTLARQLLARESGNETVEATLREVVRCTKSQIRINTFGLGADGSLRAFIERMTQINQGRAFFTTPENLGDYVLVDFLDGKRAQARAGRRAG
jgi:uncharacterized protein with von Willebrand factor type A (vWA) domain